jgi:hypothetical protein
VKLSFASLLKSINNIIYGEQDSCDRSKLVSFITASEENMNCCCIYVCVFVAYVKATYTKKKKKEEKETEKIFLERVEAAG